MQELATQKQRDTQTAVKTARAPVRRRSLGLYLALTALLVIAVAYHGRTLEQRYPQWLGIKLVMWPFLLDAEAQPHFKTSFVQPNARDAGLREGDTLLTINGVPLTSRSEYSDALAASKPGDFLNLGFRSDGEQVERHARVQLIRLEGSSGPVLLLLVVAMPATCLLLGFWVAYARPRDVRAWLLLGVMLSLAALSSSFAEFWGPSIRTLGTIYYSFMQSTWFCWLFLLGIYFPEPFSGTVRTSRWKWLVYAVISVWAVFAVAFMVSYVLELRSIEAALPINRFLAQAGAVGRICNFLLLAGFIACIGVKYRLALSADAKRRLRVLYAGAAASLLPMMIVYIVAGVKRVQAELYFPGWLMGAVYAAFILLPVTLAYVVVVQRAMDVRVVIRQGLQYTLARRGVLVLRILLSVALFVVAAFLLTSHAIRPIGTVAVVMAAGLLGIFLLQGLTQRLAVWVDRRFFRDAYNAEQILSDLAERVRTIVETQPLLEIVTQRIAESLHVKRVAVLLGGNG